MAHAFAMHTHSSSIRGPGITRCSARPAFKPFSSFGLLKRCHIMLESRRLDRIAEHRTCAAIPVQSQAVLPSRRARTACAAADVSDTVITTELQSPLQVTRRNFAATVPAIKEALQDCQFFSFDCEMTGLFLPGQDDHSVDDVDDRYVKAAAAAEQFLVAQFGLSFFKWCGNCYEARSFNFHLFPSPNGDTDLRFMSQSSALAFLAAEGFDFNKMIYEGIPFLPLSWRDKQLNSAAAAAAAVLPSPDDLDDDESWFMSHLKDQISTWLTTSAAAAAAGPAAAAGSDVLYLPAPPPQFAKLQQRLLAAGIGSSSSDLYIVTQPAPGQPALGSGSSVMLRKATLEQVEADRQFKAAHRADEVTAATGFSQIFELIRDSNKPAVGHNIRFDLAYTLAAFIQTPLPKTWAGFKNLVGQWFPGGIYDTKYLAHCLTQDAAAGGGRVLMDTSLGACYTALSQGTPEQPEPLGGSSSSSGSNSISNLADWIQDKTRNLDQPRTWQTLPIINHAPGCEAYAAAAASNSNSNSSSSNSNSSSSNSSNSSSSNSSNSSSSSNNSSSSNSSGGSSSSSNSSNSSSSNAHEAGYDAFMTGVVFVGLMRLFEIENMAQRSRWQQPLLRAAPPGLHAVQQYAWRQYFARSKHIEYAALQGPEMVPHRPEVLYVTKFNNGTKWQDIQKKFHQLGVGRPIVSMVRIKGLNSPTGAYVIFPTFYLAQKALQAVKADKKWRVTIMSYSDYFFSKHGSSSSSSSTAAVTRARPAAVAAAPAGKPAAAGDVVQQLQWRTAAAKQRQQQQQQPELPTLGGTIMGSLEEDSDGPSSSSNSNSSSDGAGPTADASTGSSSSSTDKATASSAAAALIAERQRRLDHLHQQQQRSSASPAAAIAGMQLKRPSPRPQL